MGFPIFGVGLAKDVSALDVYDRKLCDQDPFQKTMVSWRTVLEACPYPKRNHPKLQNITLAVGLL